MKTQLIALLISAMIPFLSIAQISIVSSDMAVAGDNISRQRDTLPSVNEGPSGPSQTWTFTNVVPHETVTTSVLAPGSTPYAADFPGANLCMTNDNVSFLYFTIDATAFIATGAAGDLLNTGEILKAPFSPDLTVNQYSTDYGDNYTDTYAFDVRADGSTFSAFLDSVRMKRSGTVFDTVDGWGSITTPMGTYNTLRVKRVDHQIDSIWTLANFPPFPPPQWTFLTANTDTVTSYSWIAKEGKLAVAELTFDTLDNPDVFTWTLLPAIPIANFTYTDNGTGGFSFSDQSGNTPNTWSWDFGDGNTSTGQNPAHQYMNDGTYYVCLTAFNASGSDVYCDSVTVTGAGVNPPPVAGFSYTDGGTGLFTFTDLSLNSPTGWYWDFSDGNTSTAQNPVHQYTYDLLFNVCLTATNPYGSDTYCDSVMVTGTTVTIPPVAAFTYTDSGGGTVMFIDQSSNSPTSWFWDFGDGNNGGTNNPTHYYGWVDTTYWVCLAVANSAGADTACGSVYVADTTTTGVVPVASRDIHVFPNPAIDLIRVLTGDLEDGYYSCSLHNILGERVHALRVKVYRHSAIEIPVKSLKSGAYFLNLKSERGAGNYTGKFTVQR